MIWVCLSQLDDEIYFCQQWMRSHISDHSAVNHYLQVVRRIVCCPETVQHCLSGISQPHVGVESILSVVEDALDKDKLVFLYQQWQGVTQLLDERAGHDSIWCLRRGLFVLIMNAFKTAICSADYDAMRDNSKECIHQALKRLISCLDGTPEPLDTVPDEFASSSGLTFLLSQDVGFVTRHIQRALASQQTMMWEPRLVVSTAVRYLLAVLSYCFPERPWPQECDRLIRYLSSLSFCNVAPLRFCCT